MSGQESQDLPLSKVPAFRNFLAIAGFVIWFLCVLPPLASWARQYEFVQAIQYSVFAVLTPALLVTGAPWRWLGLATREAVVIDADGNVVSPEQPLFVNRLAMARAGQPGQRRVVILAFVFVGFSIFWRTAPVVDALVRHAWLAVIESVCLVGAGVALWVDLVESPPFRPGVNRPFRIGVSAISMWVVWVLAYLVGLAHDSWYHAFHHVAGRGVSLSADQQLSAGMMWLWSAVAFMPIVFWNLIHWLQSEEDPDDELYRLVRDEKTLGFFGQKD